MQIRGGSSKGVYFLASDLPSNSFVRDQVLLDALGRDSLQIDGLGGGNPLTSKVAIVKKSTAPNVDIDYLFVQVVVGENRVDTTPNCGNILAGVGPFAIENKLIKTTSPTTNIRVNMVNTNKICELVIETPNGKIHYEGNQRIDGVPGTSAPIICNYIDVAGAVTGSLFPTGNVIDKVNGIDVTCIDNGMPVVLIRAEDLNVSGAELPAELDGNTALKEQIERIRLAISPLMNIADAQTKAIPKMCLISKPKNGGLINTRTFIPHHCHTSVGVLGAISVATACATAGTIASALVGDIAPSDNSFSVEHPSGEMTVNLDYLTNDDEQTYMLAGAIRTARLLSKGELYINSAYEHKNTEL
jgi:4-oxalomesaconate tautomerase